MKLNELAQLTGFLLVIGFVLWLSIARWNYCSNIKLVEMTGSQYMICHPGK